METYFWNGLVLQAFAEVRFAVVGMVSGLWRTAGEAFMPQVLTYKLFIDGLP